jgi:hypothetical protein
MIDFQNRRAIIVDGHDATMTFTTVQDLAAVVARVVELDEEWPVIGGIRGNQVAMSQLLKIGEKIRGATHNTSKHNKGIFDINFRASIYDRPS